MKIFNNLSSYFDFNFDKITKPVGNFISALYEKGVAYLPSLSTDTKLYKHRYLLGGVGLTLVSVLVMRHLFSNNVPSPDKPKDPDSAHPLNDLGEKFQVSCASSVNFQTFINANLRGVQGWQISENTTQVTFSVKTSSSKKGTPILAHFTLEFFSKEREWRINSPQMRNFELPFVKQEDLCTSKQVQAFVKALITSKTYSYAGVTYTLVTA